MHAKMWYNDSATQFNISAAHLFDLDIIVLGGYYVRWNKKEIDNCGR